MKIAAPMNRLIVTARRPNRAFKSFNLSPGIV